VAQLYLRLFGRFALSRASGDEIAIPSKKVQALLAYLALNPDHRRSRAELAALLWSGRGEEQARHSLRQSILTLRHALEDAENTILVSEGDHIGLNTDFVESDVSELERAAAERVPEALTRCAVLYTGDLLEGLYVKSEGFDDWLAQERHRLRELATDTLARLAALQAEAKEFDSAIETTQRLLAFDPLREDGHRLLMQLYDGTGRRALALRQFRTCQEILRRELDVEPEPETVALYETMRAGAASGDDTTAKVEMGRESEKPTERAPPELGRVATAQAASEPLTRQSPRLKPLYWAALALMAFIIAAALVYWGVYLRAPTPAFEVARKENMAFPLPEKPSIAVLPFKDMTGDPQQENFVDVITEDITTTLSIISEMFVIARSSALTYKGRPVKAQTVAEELGVRYVLLGSVQSEDGRVRVSAQLVDALQGNQEWAERYDREVGDIFALQDEITLEIITALQVEMTEGEQDRISLVHGTDDLTAWTLAGQALQHLRRLSKSDNIRARTLYRKAIELDPDYPGAWDGLAWTHLLDARFGWSSSRETSLLRAAELAQKTLSLDDTRPRSFGLLGQVTLAQGNHDKAVALGERAITLNPNGADVTALLGLTLTYTSGAERAIALLRHAMRLSPYYPDWYRWSLGRAYRLARRYNEAVPALTARLDNSPEALAPLVELAAAYSQMGRIDKARATASEVRQINREFSARAWTQNPPYADPAVASKDLNALLRAGLPE
jgi:TolB-like protein/DNA-binding SARP family transcriptional activator/Tfp pilus assembly protein PilF